MITEVVIYSDGTVNSFDSDNCQIPSASGSWEIIPLLASWALAQYPSQLPEECRMTNANVLLVLERKEVTIGCQFLYVISLKWQNILEKKGIIFVPQM